MFINFFYKVSSRATKQMDNYFGINVCRVCLIPNSIQPLTWLHGEIGNEGVLRIDTFQAVAGFKVRIEI